MSTQPPQQQQQQQEHLTRTPLRNALQDEHEETTNDNSIMDKVKLRVSSIVPDSISKWFSTPPPAPTQSSTSQQQHNGNAAGSSAAITSHDATVLAAGNVSRKRGRRRIELEAAEDDADQVFDINFCANAEGLDAEEVALAECIAEHDLADEDEQTRRNEYGNVNDNLLRKRRLCPSSYSSRVAAAYRLIDNDADKAEEDDDEEDDEDDMDEEEQGHTNALEPEQANQANFQRLNSGRNNRLCSENALKPVKPLGQQPAKRKRLMQLQEFDSTHYSPQLSLRRHSLLFSTPTNAASSNSSNTLPPSTIRSVAPNRLGHMNLYGHQRQREPAFSFFANSCNASGATGNEAAVAISGDLPNTQQAEATSGKFNMSSRRSLKIPMTDRNYCQLPSYKRQPLFSGNRALPLRTSTTIDEVTEDDPRMAAASGSATTNDVLPNSDSTKRPEVLVPPNNNNNNNNYVIFANKRSRISSSEIAADSHSEYSEESQPNHYPNYGYKGRRFINSPSNLEFYGNLQSRKSIFSNNTGVAAGLGQSSMAHHNSTLSLNSLSRRRQFNASIYGSTSALSDSRLFTNSASPFYQGRTIYGGSSANKRAFTTELALSRPLAPAAAPPVIGSLSLPVQIRPKSTDASSGSLTESAGLSKTARRILDLLDTYSTPLSDAKKIGTTLREHQQQRNAKRSAFAQSPYARPHALNNTNESVVESSNANDLLAPTMQKLLERRRLQCITESTRELLYAEQMKQAASRRELDRTLVKRLGSSSNSNTNSLKTDDNSQTISAVDKADKATQPQTQSIQSHSHTNKMRTKLSHQSRKNKEMREQDDEPPTAFNLPNIVFPEMPTAPKFDLILPMPGGFNKSNSTAVKQEVAKSPPQTHIKATSKTPNFVFSAPLPLEGQARELPKSCDRQKFKFAEPLPLKVDQKKNSTTILINGTNSSSSCSSTLHATGSVIDVILPNSTTTSTSSSSRTNDGFGNLFKNHGNEWECETCMIKNKLEVLKCVACETPKPKPKEPKPVNSVPAAVCGFGDRFKIPTSSWECEACMLSNKAEDSKCIACETPRKSAAAPATVKLNTSSMAHSFGNAFKPKSNTWECDTCMIVNQENATECVACQTPNPKGHAVKTNSSSSKVSSSTNSSSFQFGFATLNPKGKESAPKADTGFQQLVATQKSSSWNCDVCMAQNDNTRTKCICCEQLKPGTGSESNKFSFGSSHMVAAAPAATTGFQFGFAAAGGEKAKAEESNKPRGFVFGSEPGKDTGKDVADSTKTEAAKSTFMFGAPVVSVAPATEPAKSSTVATATIITTASSTTGFNFGTLNKQSAANTTQSSTASKPIAQIMFGSAATTNATTAAVTTTTTAGTNLFNFKSVASSSIVSSSTSSFSSANITTTTAISSSGSTTTTPALNFNFPGPAAKTLGSSSTSVTVSSTTLPMTSLFGSSNNSNTTAPTSTNTTTVNDMPYVFGSKPAIGTTGGSNSNTSGSKPEATPALSTFFFGQPPSTTTATTSNLSSIFGIPSSTSTAPKISNNTNTTSSATSSSSTAATPFSFGASSGTTNQVGSTTNPVAATPFAFGAPTFKPEAQPAATTAAQPIFGSSSNTSTPLFGKTSTGPTMFGNTNGPVFGSVGANGGTNMSHIPSSTPTPAMCSPFGASVTQPASGTFGSAASNPFGSTNFATPPPANMFNQPNATSAGVAKPFGGFGNPAHSMTSNTTISQPGSKPAFNFGSSVAAPANPPPGGFNFNFSGGTAAAAPAAASGLKPAFNFTGATSGTSQPATFNFTGAGSNAPTAGNNDSRPFQFNAVSVTNNAVPAPQNQMLNFTAAPPYMQIKSTSGRKSSAKCAKRAPQDTRTKSSPTATVEMAEQSATAAAGDVKLLVDCKTELDSVKMAATKYILLKQQQTQQQLKRQMPQKLGQKNKYRFVRAVAAAADNLSSSSNNNNSNTEIDTNRATLNSTPTRSTYFLRNRVKEQPMQGTTTTNEGNNKGVQMLVKSRYKLVRLQENADVVANKTSRNEQVEP